MFDETSNQLHQVASSITYSLPLHSPLPPDTSTAHDMNPFPPNYNPSRHLFPQLPPISLHVLHHQSSTHDDERDRQNTGMVSMSLTVDGQKQTPELTQHMGDDGSSWSHDEILALLRIRSSMENWFSDFTWEHVSRKLLQLGFKRSAEKCKDKFEEESRYFNANINYHKNCRFVTEFEELYWADQQNLECAKEKIPQLPENSCEGQDEMVHNLEEHSGDDEFGKPLGGVPAGQTVKRKRSSVDHKFEMFKGFCENIVNSIMAQQEEMHKKLIEDMVKRDEEKIAREETWKKQEMDKMNKELDIMAHEQAVAGDRQATIIEFLKKFAVTSPTETSNDSDYAHVPNYANHNTAPPSSLMHLDNPISHNDHQNNFGARSSPCQQSHGTSSDQNVRIIKLSCSTEKLATDNPNCPPGFSTPRSCKELPSSLTTNPYLYTTARDTTLTTGSIPTRRGASNPTPFTEKDDFGRRWPKDEVLALVNLRCSLYNNTSEDKEGTRAPLWEKISQRMMELGYQRSSKRCKEKWENINKYFRKTKNVQKKRSLDSRTCPYFHKLSAMYSQGRLISQTEMPVEYHLMTSPSDHRLDDQQHNHHDVSNITSHVHEADNKNSIHAPPFDYEL